jgi:WD40 repeat protein
LTPSLHFSRKFPISRPDQFHSFYSDEYSQSSEFRVKPKCTLGSVDVPTFCVRYDYNDKYIAAGKGDGSIEIYNLFTGKMSYICNENMENPMPTTIVRYVAKSPN